VNPPDSITNGALVRLAAPAPSAGAKDKVT
jgi:hypothetical protein